MRLREGREAVARLLDRHTMLLDMAKSGGLGVCMLSRSSRDPVGDGGDARLNSMRRASSGSW